MIFSDYMLKKLNIPKEIYDFILKTFQIYEVRGIITEINGIKFEVKTKEQGHNRAHIHASYGEFNISISIDNKIEVLSGKLPIKQTKQAINFVNDNIEKLRNEWNNVHINMKLPQTKSALLLEKV